MEEQHERTRRNPQSTGGREHEAGVNVTLMCDWMLEGQRWSVEAFCSILTAMMTLLYCRTPSQEPYVCVKKWHHPRRTGGGTKVNDVHHMTGAH